MKNYPDTHIKVEKIAPLPSGECYEAKVSRVFIENDNQDREEVFPPKYIFWGLTENEAKSKAKNDVDEWLKLMNYIKTS
ncbi:hypothetical protein [Enterobacter cloacae complex sp. ESBL7]|uniref:hypothetical protein n=1 Tax=Enterobacter cloacae complex sp. ESBL7 TaxID=3163325 RepID=UPI0035668CD4